MIKIKGTPLYYHFYDDSSYAFPGHRHSEFEMNLILRGEMEITCGSSVFRCKPGQAILFWAGVFHRNRVVSQEDVEFIAVHFQTDSEAFMKPSVFSLNELDHQLVSVIEDEAGPIVEEIGRVNEAALCLLEGLFTRLENRDPKKAIDDSPRSALYHQAVRYMESAIGENLSVSHIARRCGVCDTLLKQAFAHYAGVGVKAYFGDMKIHRAKELLLAGERAEAVAAQLGYSSPSYFSQAFKNACGVSPREFRNVK